MRLEDAVLQTTGVVYNNERFDPTKEERDLVSRVYSDFIYDQGIKNQGWDVLNGRTLNQFWAQSNADYNVIVEQDTNNPVTQYSSGIARDRANTFIANLTNAIIYPSITALNPQQEIDTTISAIAKPLLRYQYMNDGRPSESGKLKNVRYTHKQVAEGTVHILDTVGTDGKLTSSIIPNEEVFISNFFQPNIQLHGHFLQVKQWASFAETEAEFGDLPNFKFVTPGSLGWMNQTFQFKENYKALVYENQCTIVRAWYPVREQELQRLKKVGRLPKYVTKAKYFNVIINEVPMFPYDNLMPYYHGEYPITKAVFEWFSPSDFYWGNSMPNKCYQDKHYLDGIKTLFRYKAKLGAATPYLNFTGQHIENDIYVPGLITDMPANADPTKFVPAPGSDKGFTQGDIAMLRDTIDDVNRATTSPQTAGQQGGGDQTARETMVIEQNEQKIIQGLAQQIMFREEARSFPILKSSFQFLPRQKIKKIAIPNETFDDGSSGTLEVIFQKLPNMTDDQKLQHSYAILEKQKKSAKMGKPIQQVYVDPEYIQNIDLYCEAIAEELPAQNGAFKEARAEYKWGIYNNPNNPPGLFNIKRAAKTLVRELGDNPQELIMETPPPQPGTPSGQPQGQNPLPQQYAQQTAQLTPQRI